MRKAFIVLLSILMLFHLSEIRSQSANTPFSVQDYTNSIHALSEVMIRDVVSPVGASRYYAYATIAGYEVVSTLKPGQLPDLVDHLNEFQRSSRPKVADEIDLSFSVIYVTLRIGEELLPSGYLLDSIKSTISQRAQSSLDNVVFDQTVAFSESVVKEIVQYSLKDHYREINGLVKYTPKKNPGSWQPTPPAYMQAIEPYWNHIRPFVLDSVTQFKCAPPVIYSTDSASQFFHNAFEVYNAGMNLTDQQKEIADFWDCNPFAVQQVGHIDFGIKKISPGGHWMSIAGIACLKKKISIEETVLIHTLMAIAIADGFIACWDEKYRSNRIRPETFINEKIDRDWRPYLQTPPFPEYPSGHSVISNAAAVVLTKLIGQNFNYTDITEQEFSLPARNFASFEEAAQEASISRFYGGIHFMDAVTNGAKFGRQVGEWTLKKFGF